LPVFGGMVVAMITILVVPCVYTLFAERKIIQAQRKAARQGGVEVNR
jgi:hypothetical protein